MVAIQVLDTVRVVLALLYGLQVLAIVRQVYVNVAAVGGHGEAREGQFATVLVDQHLLLGVHSLEYGEELVELDYGEQGLFTGLHDVDPSPFQDGAHDGRDVGEEHPGSED